jgi:spermidine/putrescine transport system ATP-binding protein
MIEARAITKRFGALVAVDQVSLKVESGEFLTLLGPSGCGKTTLLRIFAGFETPDAGTVHLAGAEVTPLPPYRRDVNQVFQSYALFPHLSVEDNIGFGLRMRGLPRAEQRDRVAEAAAAASLGGLERRMPHQLSGGQRQRVALARALVCRPKVLLLDEPLSALDAKLRLGMQAELKRMHRRLGITFVFVTHDQHEAITMSDRIALMHRGRIEQIGSPEAIYRQPATAFAADFIGQANLLRVAVVQREAGSARVRTDQGLELTLPSDALPPGPEPFLVSIRPERIALSSEPAPGANSFAAHVEERIFQGPTDTLRVVTPSGARLSVLLAGRGPVPASWREGDPIHCAVAPGDIVVVRPAA